MPFYQTARSVRLPMYFPLREIALHGRAAMCTWYLVGPDSIVPKRRRQDETMVEEVVFVAPDGAEHKYGLSDLAHDVGMPIMENPQPWL
jgi:hypothetical protein